MENTRYLYDTLVQVLRQHRHWLDLAIARLWRG